MAKVNIDMQPQLDIKTQLDLRVIYSFDGTPLCFKHAVQGAQADFDIDPHVVDVSEWGHIPDSYKCAKCFPEGE